jgi:photosystem II stability/assembly factor-like uncharacterized protein
MNIKINRGLITLFFGLLAFTISNCNAVNTGDSSVLSQTSNNLENSENSENLTVQTSATVQEAVIQGQRTGSLKLNVSEFEMEDLNALKGRFVISTVEVSANQMNRDSDSENETDDENSTWITVSNYGTEGKSYEIIPGDANSYALDQFLLPAGDYHQIRITLVDGQSQILVQDRNDSVWHDLKASSERASDLKLRGSFTVDNSMITIVSFRIELEKESGHNRSEHHGDTDKNSKNHNDDRNKEKREKNNSDSRNYLIKPEFRFVSAAITSQPVANSVNFSTATGTYSADQSVGMTSTTVGATVCYTIDGSIPACDSVAACTSGNTYASPVAVTSTQTLSAIACKTGYMASAITSSVYTIDKAPTTPGSFSATSVSSSEIDLSWSASVDDITAQSAIVYEICQGNVSASCTTFIPVYVTTAGVVSYRITNLLAASNYYFVIRAKDQTGNISAVSSEISAATGTASLWAVQPGATTNAMLGLFESTGEKVIVGASGLILSSLDSINWVHEISNVSINLNSVAYNGLNYVIVGDAGTILYSTLMQSKTGNPTRSWSKIITKIFGNLNSVVYNAGIFVAVGDAGLIIYSTDGISWMIANSNNKKNLRNVEFYAKGFIAVGDAGALLTSVDGLNWSIPKSQVVVENLLSVATSGSQIVIVGANGASLISTDLGRSFLISRMPVQNTLTDITWDGARFIAVGFAGTIITSPDGTNWTTEISPVTNSLRHVSGMLGLDGKIHDILVGDFGTILTSI